jgi:hypothetical protein
VLVHATGHLCPLSIQQVSSTLSGTYTPALPPDPNKVIITPNVLLLQGIYGGAVECVNSRVLAVAHDSLLYLVVPCVVCMFRSGFEIG